MSSPDLRAPYGAFRERPPSRPSSLDERVSQLLTWPLRLRKQRATPYLELAALALGEATQQPGILSERAARLREDWVAARSELPLQMRALALAILAAREDGSDPSPRQVAAAAVMLGGGIAELSPGAGSDLPLVLAAGAGALRGPPVHVLGLDPARMRQLAERSRPLLETLGLRLAALEPACTGTARTDAYASDVLFAAIREVVFDGLRDAVELADAPTRLRERVARLSRAEPRALRLRGLGFALLDDADSVLLDAARIPISLSGESAVAAVAELPSTAAALAAELCEERDFARSADGMGVDLTATGRVRVAQLARPLGGAWLDAVAREGRVVEALLARHVLVRDLHYRAEDERIRFLDARWERLAAGPASGLRQALEHICGLRRDAAAGSSRRTSLTRFLQRYLVLGGVSNTAREARGELWRSHRLAVVVLDQAASRPRLSTRVYASPERCAGALVAEVLEAVSAIEPVWVLAPDPARAAAVADRLEAAGVSLVRVDGSTPEAAAQLAEVAWDARVAVVARMLPREVELPPFSRLRLLLAQLVGEARLERRLLAAGDGPGLAVASLQDDVFAGALSGALAPVERLLAGRSKPLPAPLGRVLVRFAQLRRSRELQWQRVQLARSDAQREVALAFSGNP